LGDKVKDVKKEVTARLHDWEIGDALGYHVKFMSLKQIKYGRHGLMDLHIYQESNTALIFDGTQMTLFPADGMV